MKKSSRFTGIIVMLALIGGNLSFTPVESTAKISADVEKPIILCHQKQIEDGGIMKYEGSSVSFCIRDNVALQSVLLNGKEIAKGGEKEISGKTNLYGTNYLKAIDTSGNMTSIKIEVSKLDTIPPEIICDGNPISESNVYMKDNGPVQVYITDHAKYSSGCIGTIKINNVSYRGKMESNGAYRITLEEPGKYNIFVSDTWGNTKTVDVIILDDGKIVEEATTEEVTTEHPIEEKTTEQKLTESPLVEETTERVTTENKVEKETTEKATTEDKVEEETTEKATTEDKVEEETTEKITTENKVEKETTEKATTENKVEKETTEKATTEDKVEKETTEKITTEHLIKEETTQSVTTESSSSIKNSQINKEISNVGAKPQNVEENRKTDSTQVKNAVFENTKNSLENEKEAIKKLTSQKAVIKSVKNRKGNKIFLKFGNAKMGYQIKISMSKKFKGNTNKNYYSLKNSYTAKLKKKGCYYIKVRMCSVDVQGNKVYSKWSNVKRIKLK